MRFRYWFLSAACNVRSCLSWTILCRCVSIAWQWSSGVRLNMIYESLYIMDTQVKSRESIVEGKRARSRSLKYTIWWETVDIVKRYIEIRDRHWEHHSYEVSMVISMFLSLLLQSPNLPYSIAPGDKDAVQCSRELDQQFLICIELRQRYLKIYYVTFCKTTMKAEQTGIDSFRSTQK